MINIKFNPDKHFEIILKTQANVIWDDYPKFFKSGSYFQRQTYLKVVPSSDPVIRSKIVEVDTLILSTLTHEERVTTIFGTDDK